MIIGELFRYNVIEVVLGFGLELDEVFGVWVRVNIIFSVYYLVGMVVKMLREWGGVVGEDLMVYGVRGLSVVDVLMMLIIVVGIISMMVYVVVEKVRIDFDFFLLNL